MKDDAKAEVVSSQVYRSKEAVDQLEVYVSKGALAHVQEVVGVAAVVKDHLVVVRVDGNLLDHRVGAEVRGHVVAGQGGGEQVDVSGGVQV